MNLCSYKKINLIFLLINILSATAVKAADFYVDPVRGSMSGDGSIKHPWSTMKEVWDECKIQTREYTTPYNSSSPAIKIKCPNGPVRAGDTIYLLSGYHGDLVIAGAVNTDYITVKAAPGATPRFKHISLTAASKWIFNGVSISPSHAPVFSKDSAIFEAAGHNWLGPADHITLQNSTVFSVPDISGYTIQNWKDNTLDGVVVVDADYCALENIDVSNIRVGVIFMESDYAAIRNSKIKNFHSDGLIFAQSNYTKIEYNIIKNSYYLDDDNHPDLIQSWSLGPDVGKGTIIGAEIRGNILIGHEDEKQPLSSELQGIGMFDGFYKDFVIENNLIINNMYHAITLMGAINCRIINNTAVYPWPKATYQVAPISIYGHKNGAEGHGNIIRNNIASSFHIEGINGVQDHNKVILSSDYAQHFTDPANFNFSLKKSSNAINTGSTEIAPTVDITKAKRDNAIDIGAYEYR
jgi:parallel beta-helix repeat protein